MSGGRLLSSMLLAAMGIGASHAEDTSMIERGQAAFQRHCAACHGPGQGNDSELTAMLPGTLALRLKYRGALPALLEHRTDLSAESIRAFVRNGVASMPPFRPTEVTDEDIEAIAAFLAPSRR
jgi:(+)-pinoresinol hydroxylase